MKTGAWLVHNGLLAMVNDILYNHAWQEIRLTVQTHGMSLREMVLKRAMSNPGVTSSLCGVRPARQLQMNLRAAAQPLDSSAVKELNRLTQPLLEKLGPSFDYYEPLNNDQTW
jgi:aryl-alcohol dehydrogenase-like predicted oxidoreductase